jgi:hypothetical protein
LTRLSSQHASRIAVTRDDHQPRCGLQRPIDSDFLSSPIRPTFAVSAAGIFFPLRKNFPV